MATYTIPESLSLRNRCRCKLLQNYSNRHERKLAYFIKGSQNGPIRVPAKAWTVWRYVGIPKDVATFSPINQSGLLLCIVVNHS